MNPRPLHHELPYHPDSSRLFAPLAAEPWAAFLDSGHPATTQGRYDILCADPSVTLVARGELTEIRTRRVTLLSREDPFELVRRYLDGGGTVPEGLPFAGGAVGYFGYDLARRLERLPALADAAAAPPEMAVGIYDWAVVVDHVRQRSWLLAQGRDPVTRARWSERVERFSAPPAADTPPHFRLTGAVRFNMDAQEYARAFAAVQRFLRAGDCYQVNLAQGFGAPAQGDPWALYLALRRGNPAPFAAWLHTPEVRILSASPERFLRCAAGRVQTRPIKGTRPRRTDPAADAAQAQALHASEKDRAENLMIVDLLRNDLGKTCAPGSVSVPRLFEVESFATVHHLVSTVEGELAPGRHALDLLRGCFPGGSITGAPKLRAMEIIEGLEPQRRGIYCGAIGYIGFDGAMDTNIAIRTLVHTGDAVHGWAGGGIVVDSTAEGEYRESLDKAAPLLRALEAFRTE